MGKQSISPVTWLIFQKIIPDLAAVKVSSLFSRCSYNIQAYSHSLHHLRRHQPKYQIWLRAFNTCPHRTSCIQQILFLILIEFG